MSISFLFEPIRLGAIDLRNRMVMAPLTRGRSGPDRIPNALMAKYYRQRASAGLIITEATQVSEQAAGWAETPGIYSQEQIQAWQQVTDAVHQQGGKIVLQIWHTGRASHPDFQLNGARPISASAIKPAGEVHTPQGKKPFVTPRAVSLEEIPGLVQDFAQATRNARQAGFDGVEIHAANGYLIDQFLRDGTNQRQDAYGGTIENRARFLLEVTAAAVNAWSADHIGVRLSPTNAFNDMRDSNPISTFTYAAQALNSFNLAYLHLLEALPGHMLAVEGERVSPYIRKIFQGPLMINGGYDAVSGAAAIANQDADLVAYGIPFIANPDLPERFAQQAPLNKPDPSTFYTRGAKGYTDYPALSPLPTVA
ncbi:alkene reductase [Acaryochloris sp. IP29b_bin.148]|uniref:alkene reductase n=1 Tax=Acaryochloris sp. IP29b_bin.148 TaxID=2969218 RepID=UPI0026069CB9|nr:alkene reductase [Acaryochloris sp. IP29b_bin.148]